MGGGSHARGRVGQHRGQTEAAQHPPQYAILKPDP